MAKLNVKKRELIGKKVKNLRNEGIVPAVLFGPVFGSVNVEINDKEFRGVFSESGYSKLVDLEFDGKKEQVVVKEVQAHPVTDVIEHVSLYVIDQGRAINAEIPLNLTGNSPAVDDGLGFLVSSIDNASVRCLPKDLPAEIEVSINGLAQIGDSITFADIVLPEGVEYDSSVDPTTAVAYIVGAQKLEVEEVEEEGLEEGEEGAEAEGDSTDAETAEAE